MCCVYFAEVVLEDVDFKELAKKRRSFNGIKNRKFPMWIDGRVAQNYPSDLVRAPYSGEAVSWRMDEGVLYTPENPMRFQMLGL